MLRAVLLDRDGVINFDSPEYILSPEQWRPIPGSMEAIARLCRAGLAVAIVSNQSALGRGMIDLDTFNAIHESMLRAIRQAGGRLQGVAYCPHAPDDDCPCRKPRPGLLHQALRQCHAKPQEAVMIGDSLRDVRAALAANVRPILVRSGYGDATEIATSAHRLDATIPVYDNLAEAVDALLTEHA